MIRCADQNKTRLQYSHQIRWTLRLKHGKMNKNYKDGQAVINLYELSNMWLNTKVLEL